MFITFIKTQKVRHIRFKATTLHFQLTCLEGFVVQSKNKSVIYLPPLWSQFLHWTDSTGYCIHNINMILRSVASYYKDEYID
jgi:hypothetical protein